MEKPFACLEISSRKIKFLLGYELSNQPVILYSKEVNHNFVNGDGTIKDEEGLIKLLQDFKEIKDDNAKLKLSVKHVCLIFPSFGLNVYTSRKSSMTVSQDSLISQTDIANVNMQLNKENPPKGYSIVDTIPEYFILDGNKATKEPPINMVSKTLTIQAKIYTLPTAIYHGYRSVVEKAGFRIRRFAIASYAYAELFGRNPDYPETYFLVDVGANITTVSFVGGKIPYRSVNFEFGGENLTRAISNAFLIDIEKARKLKEDYGYQDKQLSYKPELGSYIDSNGKTVTYNQMDLNSLIVDWVEEFQDKLEIALANAAKVVQGNTSNLPILLTGGGMKLRGLLTLIEASSRGMRKFIKTEERIIGGRDPSYAALLGLILVSNAYKGSLSESFNEVISLSREDDKKEEENEKPKKKRWFAKENKEDLI